jgi:hypothetical protein
MGAIIYLSIYKNAKDYLQRVFPIQRISKCLTGEVSDREEEEANR